MLDTNIDPADSMETEEVAFTPHPYNPHVKQFAAVIGIFVLLIGLGVTVNLTLKSQNNRTSASTNLVDLSLSANKTTILPLEQVSFTISAITHNYKVAAVSLHLQFDPDKFEFVSLTKGDFLPKQLEFSTGSGIAKITLGSQPENPRTGAGILANLVLKAKSGSLGSSTIKVDQATLITGIDTNGSAVPTSILGIIPQSNITIKLPNPTSHPGLKLFLYKKTK